MGSLEKLKARLAANPRPVRFSDLARVLRDLGFTEVRSRGSHHVFRPAGAGPSILIVKPHGGKALCAIADLKKVIELLEVSEDHHEKD